jgi:hypothetical protein
MLPDKKSPRFFAVTTPGLSATRWLAYVLTAHPDVYVAHGKHALDALVQGQFTQEQQTSDALSLVRGNEMRELYEGASLEEVFACYQQTRPEACVYGCVHSYTLDSLIRAARNPQTLANLRILNLVRHPVTYIASHYALVRSAEKHPRLYQLYVERVFPQALREFPELFLMPCSDLRAFLAFATSCLGVSNLIRSLVFAGVRTVKMEELTTRIERLQSVCQELTGFSYSQALLRPFLSRGAINQHRPKNASKEPRLVFTDWEPWQQDMAQMMIPGTVLDWLEEMDYDVTMLRVQKSAPGKSNAPSSETAVPSLADYLRMLDQRHPYLAHLTQPGPSVVQFIETEQRCFELVHQEGKVYAVARSLDVREHHRLSTEDLQQLEIEGLCFCTDSVAEAWVAIAREMFPHPEEVAAKLRRTSPQLIEEGFKKFNLIAYEGKVFAMAQSVGPIDLASLSTTELKHLCNREQAYVADSAEDARRWIEKFHQRLRSRSLASTYKGFNLVAFRGRIWAVMQALEPLDLDELSAGDFEEHQRDGRIFVAASVAEARRKVDQTSRPPRRRFFSKLYRLAARRFPSLDAS